MKTPCQRLLSLLLVFVLVLSLIPSVYAADNDESTPTEPEATETTASTESPTTTPPQSDPSEETEGSSAGAPDSQPDNEYGIATTARLAPSPSLLSSKRRRRFLLLKTRPILFGTCPAPLTRQRSTCTVLSPVR